ncbi:MAG: T9SS type A sorting domain-containing protein [Saprospiraceae bacterium]
MKIIQIFLLFIMVSSSWAQTLQPEFSFTLYAEDARGNKDSVIIGYHPDARADQVLDTRFADKDISHVPFDSVFEIRVHKVRFLYNRGVQNPAFLNKGISKHVTLGHPTSNCLESAYIGNATARGYILVKIKYPPIRFYWDSVLFSKNINPCASRSFMFNNELHADVSLVERLNITYLEEKSFRTDSIMVPVVIKLLDGKIDSFQANYLFDFHTLGSFVSTKDYSTLKNLKAYPNPSQDELHIPIPELTGEKLSIKIFRKDGILIAAPYTQSNDKITVQTADLPPGQYFMSLNTSDGRAYSTKFIKVE